MANPEHSKILKVGVEAWNDWRDKNRHTQPDLSEDNLSGANLAGINLREADLSGAKLSGANLSGANLQEAFLTDAILTRVVLIGAVLGRTVLRGADLEGAKFGFTILGSVDLSETQGLQRVEHFGPSTIGLNTFFASKGKIPEVFLRGAGVPDLFLQYAASLAGKPFEFYSCFMSCSTKDGEFATRLDNDFQANGIRCWKGDRDARTGRSLPGEIDRAIRDYHKLVLIASESSLKSPAVNREIERALVQEDERLKRKHAGDSDVDCDVLFPVRLDDFIFKGWEHERKVDVAKKVIADARGWATDPAVYRRVLERLLRDLKSEKPKAEPKSKVKALLLPERCHLDRAKNRAHPDVLQVRWRIYARTKKWDVRLDIATALTKLTPDRRSGWPRPARRSGRAAARSWPTWSTWSHSGQSAAMRTPGSPRLGG